MSNEFENKTPREALEEIVGTLFDDKKYGSIHKWLWHYYLEGPGSEFDSNHPAIHTEWLDAVRIRNAGGRGQDRIYDIEECEFILKQPVESDKPTQITNRYGRTPNEWSGHIVRSVREGKRFIPFEEWRGDPQGELAVDEPRFYNAGISGEDGLPGEEGSKRFYSPGETNEDAIRRIVREEFKRINDAIAKPLLSERNQGD